MQVNPYLFFNGNCEAALKFYQKVLGAQIEAMFPYESGGDAMPIPPEWNKKIGSFMCVAPGAPGA